MQAYGQRQQAYGQPQPGGSCHFSFNSKTGRSNNTAIMSDVGVGVVTLLILFGVARAAAR